MRSLFVILSCVLIPGLIFGEEASCLAPFRSSLGDYIGVAEAVQREPSSETQKAMVEDLFELGQEMAKLYLYCENEREQIAIETELGASLRGHLDLDKLWIPLGESFVQIADTLLSARKAKLRRINLVGAGVLGALGLAVTGGLVVLKYIPQTPGLVMTSLATGGLVGAGAGYFLLGPALSAAFLPRDPLAQNAEDFLSRYPLGMDFLEAVSSIDLILEADDLNER